ncbi:MAG: zf-HC2 domain-containing protein [Gammaproteobacteria bacterium]|nr:zf-HC2 domain-containing protein [Gammaproteobacteria bacterium]
MLTCKESSQLISQQQDRPLTLAERVKLILHLWFCRHCQCFNAQMISLRQRFRSAPESLFSTKTLSPEAKQRILNNLRADQERNQ